MATLLLAALLSFVDPFVPASSAPLTQTAQPPSTTPPCTTPHHAQFDFWVGEWEVRGPKGNVIGTSRIEKIEAGCGIQENWTDARGVTGRSINAFSNTDRKWHQAWIGSGGQFLHLAGELRGKEMVLEGAAINQTKQPTIERVTWTPQADGRVRQFWQQSIDGGKTWTTVFDGMYSKKQ
jgi:hypothetical protein